MHEERRDRGTGDRRDQIDQIVVDHGELIDDARPGSVVRPA